MKALLTLFFMVAVASTTNISLAQLNLDSSKAEEFINELYLDCPDYRNELEIERAKEKISRIVIHQVPLEDYPECPKLSSCDLIDKCNQNLSHFTGVFDLNTFNPLIYRMKFYSVEKEYYRIDNNPYIIEIFPENH